MVICPELATPAPEAPTLLLIELPLMVQPVTAIVPVF
jgi:hypothetical protein